MSYFSFGYRYALTYTELTDKGYILFNAKTLPKAKNTLKNLFREGYSI